MSDKIRVFKVSRRDMGGKHWVTKDWNAILDCEFDHSEPDKITIETAYMTIDELNALPDFEGW